MLDNEIIQDSVNTDDSKDLRQNLVTGGLTDIQFDVESQYDDGIATYMETKFNTTFTQTGSGKNKIKFDVLAKVKANRHFFLISCLINFLLLKIKIYFIKIKAFRLTPSSVYDTRKKC